MQSIGGLKQGARLQQAGICKVNRAHNRSGAKGENSGGAVGLARQHRRQNKVGPTQSEYLANAKPKPVHEHPVHHRPGQGVLPVKSRGKFHGGLQNNCAVNRVGAIDGFDLGKPAFGPAAALHHRHRAEIDDLGISKRGGLHPAALVVRCKAICQLDLGVAAQYRGTLAQQTQLNAFAHRAHSSNCRNAQRQTGQKHPKPLQTAVQLPARNSGNDGQAHGAASSAGARSMRPSRRRITRSQRAASSGS